MTFFTSENPAFVLEIHSQYPRKPQLKPNANVFQQYAKQYWSPFTGSNVTLQSPELGKYYTHMGTSTRKVHKKNIETPMTHPSHAYFLLSC